MNREPGISEKFWKFISRVCTSVSPFCTAWYLIQRGRPINRSTWAAPFSLQMQSAEGSPKQLDSYKHCACSKVAAFAPRIAAWPLESCMLEKTTKVERINNLKVITGSSFTPLLLHATWELAAQFCIVHQLILWPSITARILNRTANAFTLISIDFDENSVVLDWCFEYDWINCFHGLFCLRKATNCH